jgi:flavodoxin/Pyruvate/2-oxoacid:ferredoxin oxidoreductase delta subunit
MIFIPIKTKEKKMVLYFSGTGNSRYVAEFVAKIIGDEVASINALIKGKNKSPIMSAKPFVITAPVYAGRIPRIADKFIREIEFKGNKNVYFIVTCAQTPWNTQAYIEKLCNNKGFNLLGLNSLVMPQNYIEHTDIKSDAENDEIINSAIPKIKLLAETIKDGKPFPKEEPGKSFMSKVLNPIMYAFIVKAKGFYTTDLCKGCGKCAERCPLNNIKIVNGKPQWGKECTHCMACIGGCSNKAIENGKKTIGRNRYYNTKLPPQ